MDWMRLDAGFVDHFKHGRLAHRLEVKRDEAIVLVLKLWSWCAKTREDGDLRDLEPIDLAQVVGWSGDPDRLVEAMLEVRWLREDDGLVVNDWLDHQPLQKRRAHDRKYRSRGREGAKDGQTGPPYIGESEGEHATSTPRAREGPENTPEREAPARANGHTDIRTNGQTDDGADAPAPIRWPTKSGLEVIDEAKVAEWEGRYPELDVRRVLAEGVDWWSTQRKSKLPVSGERSAGNWLRGEPMRKGTVEPPAQETPREPDPEPDRDHAVSWLRKGVAESSPGLIDTWAPLCRAKWPGDPEVRELLERVGASG